KTRTIHSSFIQDRINVDKIDNDNEAERNAAPDVEFALAEARRLAQKEGSDPRAYARLLLRAVDGLLEQDRAPQAVTIARETVEALKDTPLGGDIDLATALIQLSRAEAADGDLSAARDHVERAVALRKARVAHNEQN